MSDDIDIDKDDENVLAAEYTLGLLSAEETAAFEELLDIDPAFRRRYAFWAENFAALTDEIAEVTPPADLKDRIERVLFPAQSLSKAEPLAADGAQERPSLLQRLGLLPAIAGGLIAALVVLGVINLVVDVDPEAPAYVAELAAEDDGLVLLASVYAADHSLVIDRTAGAAAEGRSLEVWLIPAGDGQAPISLGLLSDDAETTIIVPDPLVPLVPGGTLAVSDEPEGGSPTGAPTGDILATGAIISA